jgi:hypothetical protein
LNSFLACCILLAWRATTINESPPGGNKPSQTCHACGAAKKKPLSQRWHGCGCGCGCGVGARRDLYSAFLAMNASRGDLDVRQAREAWPGAGPPLRRAMPGCDQAAIGGARLASFGLNRGQSGSRDEGGSALDDARDVVVGRGVGEILGRFSVLPSEPPAFRPGEVQSPALRKAGPRKQSREPKARGFFMGSWPGRGIPPWWAGPKKP